MLSESFFPKMVAFPYETRRVVLALISPAILTGPSVVIVLFET